MEQIRCLISDISQNLLADIVQNLAEETDDIVIVDRIDASDNYQQIIQSQCIDVLIIGMKDYDLHQAYVNLMENLPDLLLLGMVDDGRKLLVYMNDIGKNEFIDLIRLFGKR